MTEIVRKPKPLAVNPLKVSQPVGACLAFLGLNRAMPLMHGSQGCTAFAKVFLVRHFREPIPLQTTAMDQVSSIMGADDNVVEALAVIAGKSRPDVIGLVTTGLSETQGTDIRRLVRRFRSEHPDLEGVAVVPVSTPDYAGCLETGYALAVEAIIDTLVPQASAPGRRPKQVNVLVGSHLTPGDLEAVKDWIEWFGLRPLFLPDVSDSLDGHLVEAENSATTVGGTPAADVAIMGESAATLVIGAALSAAADRLKAKTGVPDFRFDGLMGLEACDAFTRVLVEVSGRPVPERLDRQRAQLQDAMVDSHFMTGFARLALAGDPDLVAAFARFLAGVGAEVVAAVSPVKSPVLETLPLAQVIVGDLDDLEKAARAAGARILVANSHAEQSARRLGVPLIRAGFPQYDHVGGYARCWVGYRGSRQALFDLANVVLSRHHEIQPYRSRFWAGSFRDHERDLESRSFATPTAAGLVH